MRSMTGFGRGEAAANGWQVEVELSGVNRKQSDINVNLPGSLLEVEGDVRRALAEVISRGRLNAKINFNRESAGDSSLVFDEALATEYVEAAKMLSEKTGIETRFTAADLFRAPGVFKLDDAGVPLSEVKEAILAALQNAIRNFVQMQEEEGEHLRKDLSSRIDNIVEAVAAIRDRSATVPEQYRKNLHSRLSEAGLEIDLSDERVLREIALYAERCDITEEVTRIDHHVAQFRTYIASEEPTGRPLDFLCQELNRELNTIGSKANDAEIAREIVNAKTELEKIREQVQNVQ